MGETSFEREVLDRLTKIEVKLDGFDEVKKVTYDNQKDILLLKEAHERSRWMIRTISSALVVAIVALVFTYIKLGGI